jgi:hypothetical protein
LWCLGKLGINHKPDDAVLVLLAIRDLFDHAFDRNSLLLVSGENVIK